MFCSHSTSNWIAPDPDLQGRRTTTRSTLWAVGHVWFWANSTRENIRSKSILRKQHLTNMCTWMMARCHQVRICSSLRYRVLKILSWHSLPFRNRNWEVKICSPQSRFIALKVVIYRVFFLYYYCYAIIYFLTPFSRLVWLLMLSYNVLKLIIVVMCSLRDAKLLLHHFLSTMCFCSLEQFEFLCFFLTLDFSWSQIFSFKLLGCWNESAVFPTKNQIEEATSDSYEAMAKLFVVVGSTGEKNS